MSLEQRFEFLDAIPNTLYDEVITHPWGRLRERVEGVRQWREALLAGKYPDVHKLHWPDAEVAALILRRLDALEITQYCKGEADLVDQILKDILIAEARIMQRRELGIESEPEAGSDHRSAQALGRDEAGKGSRFETTNTAPVSGEGPWRAALEADLQARWTRLLAAWRRAGETLGDLNLRPGLGWDLSRGVLNEQDLDELESLRSTLEPLPELTDLVAKLGRRQGRDDRAADTPSPSFRVKPNPGPDPQPNPLQTRGVQRSDDIARMLPAEAAMLGHRQLKMLWHARRAERALLTYQVEGVLSEHEPVFDAPEARTERTGPTQSVAGPILLCLDTSGSMQGKPERIAKALVLEIWRQARLMQREAFLFAFSGPGQLLDMPLSPDETDMAALMDFLRHSFHGGTDVGGVLESALRRQREQTWRDADILLITDSRFPRPVELIEPITTARQDDGLRVHALLLGRWRGLSLEGVCDPIHRFSDWRRVSASFHT